MRYIVGFLIILNGIIRIDSTFANESSLKVQWQLTRYQDTGNPCRVFQAYHSGMRWIKHGQEIVYYNVPGKKEATVCSWRHGVLHGLYVEKYLDGTIKLSGNYEQGLRVGRWVAYYPNGKIKMEGEYDRDEKKGSFVEYSEEGVKIKEVPYQRNKIHGTMYEFYPNGKNKQTAQYTYGELNGWRMEWYENGNPKIKVCYQDGKKHGIETEWDENGQLLREVEYNKGQQEGWVREYTKGILSREAQYRGQKLNGIYRSYYGKGRLSYEAVYKDGILDGPEVFYYLNGQKHIQNNWQDGKRTGPQMVYYVNGNIRSVITLKLDRKHGAAKWFNPEGKVIAEGTFRNDEPWDGTFVFWEEEKPENESAVFPESFWVYHYQNGQETNFHYVLKGHLANGTVTFYYPNSNQILRVASFKDGKLNGEDVWYFPTGEKQYEIHWTDNQLNGLVSEWYVNGNKKWEVQYVQGVKDGYERLWDMRGHLLCDGVYRKGQPWEGTLFVYNEKMKDKIILSYEKGKALDTPPKTLQFAILKLPDISRVPHSVRQQKQN